MGNYVDPNNESFASVRNNDIYVDKSGLIRFTNNLLGKQRNKICVTRPRRFGKSIAFHMLTAYYSCSCDSRALFQDLQIAQDPSFLEQINKYHVIRVDVQAVWRSARSMQKEDQMVSLLQDGIIQEIAQVFSGYSIPKTGLAEILSSLYIQDNNIHFIFLLDEWDVLFRNPKISHDLKDDYLSLLVSLFKNTYTENCISMVYMTGILPVIKYVQDTDNQSLLNNFTEYSMVRPGALSEYIGFTESEVAFLCQKWNMPLDEVKVWYDGYHLSKLDSVFCPESVYMALTENRLDNYWAGTSGFRVVLDFLRVNLSGLKEAVESLLAGESVEIDPSKFMNNVNMIYSTDDVLTLLVHYGYLSYEEDTGSVRIPNREVKREFRKALDELDCAEYGALQDIVNGSLGLLKSTWARDEKEVAKQIQKVHDYKTSPMNYNREEALRSVINLAYIAADAFYMMIPEMPGGEGFADIAFIPKSSAHIPMILELKWNQDAETALNQIREKKYHGRLCHYRQILLVGISYTRGARKKNGKKHVCRIELWQNPDPGSVTAAGTV